MLETLGWNASNTLSLKAFESKSKKLDNDKDGERDPLANSKSMNYINMEVSNLRTSWYEQISLNFQTFLQAFFQLEIKAKKVIWW